MTSNRNISSLLKQSSIVNSNKMKWIKSKSKTMDTKKSNSCWWSSLISLKNSKWLQDNLEEMDQKLKLMLKLIEEDADSFAKRAEMYYQKRPELITLVEDFNRMYHELAERYDAITRELRKNHVLPYDYLQSNGSETSDVGLPPPNSPSPEEQDWLRRRITDLETELSHVKENENSISMLGAQIQQLKAEICKKNGDVGELNKMVEDLKANYDELRSEKESLDAKISTLFAEMGSKDEMVDHLSERVKELEMEVERKEEVIKQGAEEKREAIRQLCFSIEHYRNGYHRSR